MANFDDVSKKTVDKTIDLLIKATKLTPDLLKSAMNAYLNQSFKKTGKVNIENLAMKSGSKLDSIEISDANIKDFKKTADKHDITYALKKDSGVTPPIYHVFFQTSKAENFKKAFAEYADVMQKKLDKKSYELPIQKSKEMSNDLSKNQQSKSKEKIREKVNQHEH